jgi:signal transduction histidine kinase
MTDLSETLYRKIATQLEGQRAAIARYAGLLEAQRAALNSQDLDLLADVSREAAQLLSGLETATRQLNEVCGPTAGPRHADVQAMLAALAVELRSMLDEARQFAEALQLQRARLIRAIHEEDGAHPGLPGKSFRSGPGDSAFLDRSG